MPTNKKFVKTQEVWDWASIPTGTYFTAILHGDERVRGIVMQASPEDGESLYLCTSDEGAREWWTRESDSGFKYYRVINHDEEDIETALEENYMKSISFPPKPRNFKVPIILPKMAGYTPVIKKGHVEFGCQTVSNEHIRLLAENLID